MPAPAFRNTFVGRAAEAEAVLTALSQPGALVCLVGPGGVGKTRLAVEALRAYRGPLVFVDLSEAVTAQDMQDAVVGALGLRILASQGDDTVADQVEAWLAHRSRLLVVLDNTEQLEASAAALVARWRQAAPRCRFLVTSRRVLGVAAEAEIRLAPLSLEEGADLFLSRVPPTAAAPDRVTDRATVRQIVDRVDALPLAIELAAARLEILTPAALVAALSDRFGVVQEPGAARAPRHRSLHAVIVWSWRLLAPWQRQAMVELSTFRGGAPLDAATDVLLAGDPAHDGAQVLESLVDASLVRADEPVEGVPRYSMLVSIAQFVQEEARADPGLAAAELRHAQWFLAHAPAWSAAYDADDGARRRLGVENPNLEAVRERGLRDDDGSGAARAVAAVACARRIAWRAPSPAMIERADAVIEAAARHRLPPSRELYWCLVHRGYVLRWTGRIAQALADMTAATDMARGLGDRKLEVSVLGYAGSLQVLLGLDEQGRATYEAVLELAVALADRSLEGRALQALASYDARNGRLDDALDRLNEALACFHEVGSDLYAGRARMKLGAVYFITGALDRSVDLLRSSIETEDEAGVKADIHAFIGRALHASGDLDAAERAFADVTPYLEDLPAANPEPRLWSALLDIERGRTAEARAKLEGALRQLLPEAAHDRGLAVVARCGLGLLAAADLDAAATRGHRGAIAALLPAAPFVARPLHAMVPILETLARAAEAVAGRRSDVARSELDAALHTGEQLRGPAGAARVVRRLLAHTVAEVDALVRAWQVARDGRWFAPPGAARVEIGHRPTLVRVVEALVEARLADPERAIPLDALFERVWGPEVVVADAAANRVYNAMSTLRGLGLTIIESGEHGYRLASRVTVHVEPDGAA